MNNPSSDEGLDEYDYMIPVNFYGNPSVGKTCLLFRMKHGKYKEYGNSIFLEYAAKTVDIQGLRVRISMWDYAGDNYCRDAVQQEFKGKPACLVIFDISNRKSFIDISEWLERLKELAHPDATIFLVGSKCDMENERKVTRDQAEALAMRFEIKYMEVSSMTGQNVNELFNKIGINVIRKIRDNKFDLEKGNTGIKAKGYHIKSSKLTKKRSTQNNDKGKSICSKLFGYFQ